MLETAAVSIASYKDITVEKVNDFTVRLTFAKPTPSLGRCLCRQLRHDHPEAPVQGLRRRQSCARRRTISSRSAPALYLFVDFKPGDMLPRQDQSPTTTSPTGRISMRWRSRAAWRRGVGGARGAADTGEYDYAWNMLVEEEILQKLEAAGKGRVNITLSGNVEFMPLNSTDPVDRGRRGAARIRTNTRC